MTQESEEYGTNEPIARLGKLKQKLGTRLSPEVLQELDIDNELTQIFNQLSTQGSSATCTEQHYAMTLGGMTNKMPRGKALIFNSVDGFKKHPKRTGSEEDVNKLVEQFKDLGFAINVYRNYRSHEMDDAIESELKTCEGIDCIACIFLSHGAADGHIWDVSGIHFLLADKVALFHECAALKDKPKLFILQTCRGRKQDKGDGFTDAVVDFDTYHSIEEATKDRGESAFLGGSDKNEDVEIEFENGTAIKGIPVGKDILLCYACVDGYTSCRTPTGSYFIQTLCDVMKDDKFEVDFCSLLTCVSRIVAAEPVDRNGKLWQLPCFTSMLTKTLKFSKPKIDLSNPPKVKYHKYEGTGLH